MGYSGGAGLNSLAIAGALKWPDPPVAQMFREHTIREMEAAARLLRRQGNAIGAQVVKIVRLDAKCNAMERRAEDTSEIERQMLALCADVDRMRARSKG